MTIFGRLNTFLGQLGPFVTAARKIALMCLYITMLLSALCSPLRSRVAATRLVVKAGLTLLLNQRVIQQHAKSIQLISYVHLLPYGQRWNWGTKKICRVQTCKDFYKTQRTTRTLSNSTPAWYPIERRQRFFTKIFYSLLNPSVPHRICASTSPPLPWPLLLSRPPAGEAFSQ